MDEVSKRLVDLWGSQIALTNPEPFEYMRKRQRMVDAYDDMQAGGQWWTRSWLWSLPEHKGGAPTIPIKVTKGLAHDFINIGPFRISNKFKFKLRSYDVTLTKPQAVHRWKLKISPKLKVDIRDYVRQVRVALRFIYSRRHINLISIDVYSGYRVRLGAILGIQISMLHW